MEQHREALYSCSAVESSKVALNTEKENIEKTFPREPRVEGSDNPRLQVILLEQLTCSCVLTGSMSVWMAS
jgi:hypothetical protein